MSLPRIYADFNAIEYRRGGTSIADVALTGYGTLGSLARLGLRLSEGMPLVIYEPNDIECDGVAHFDRGRTDPAGRSGEWVAVIDHLKTRNCAEGWDPSNAHPCIVCGHDFAETFLAVGRRYVEHCAKCGASVMEPMAPPADAT